VQSSSAAIVSTTTDGAITSWNAGAAAVFGRSRPAPATKLLPLVSSRDILPVIVDAEMPGSALLDQTLETKPGIRILRVSSGAGWWDEPGSVTSTDTPHIRRLFTALELRKSCVCCWQPAQRR
jgi:PAS domain-containing protein